MLARAVDASFNAISVDSDTSTSDTVVAAFLRPRALRESRCLRARADDQVCRDLAEDVVRNGEGVRHVIRVTVKHAAQPRNSPGRSARPSSTLRSSNAPWPATTRMSAASCRPSASTSARTHPARICRMLRSRIGGIEIFAGGVFQLDSGQGEGPGGAPAAAPSCTPARHRRTASSPRPSIFRRTSAAWRSKSTSASAPRPPWCSAAISPTNT